MRNSRKSKKESETTKRKMRKVREKENDKNRMRKTVEYCSNYGLFNLVVYSKLIYSDYSDQFFSFISTLVYKREDREQKIYNKKGKIIKRKCGERINQEIETKKRKN